MTDVDKAGQGIDDITARGAQAFLELTTQIDHYRPLLELKGTYRVGIRDSSVHPMIPWRAGLMAVALATLFLTIPWSRAPDAVPKQQLNEFTAASDQLFDPYSSNWPVSNAEPTLLQN